MSFKFTPSNDRVLCDYAPLGYSTRKQLAVRGGGGFSLKVTNDMENKNQRNENKIIHGNFNYTMDKMYRDVEKKHKDFIYAVPIMDPIMMQFQVCIKNTKKTTILKQVTRGNKTNLVLKRMLRFFLKIPPLKKIL